MALDDSRLRAPVLDALGIVVRAPGEAALELQPYVVNSLGATQGGALATLAEVAAESVDPTHRSATVDLQLSYLALAKVGPIVATAQSAGDEGVVRVVIVDVGTQRTAAHALIRLAADA
jgi:acyl-coenzyme A thioesterase PaaI-like protein